MQNGPVERFNGRMRDARLKETMCRNLEHARVVITAWAADQNTERQHAALDCQTLADCVPALTTAIALSWKALPRFRTGRPDRCRLTALGSVADR